MTETCSVEGCIRERYCRGMCAKHYQASRKDRTSPCSVEGCNTGQYARGWCRSHYDRWKNHGDPHYQHAPPPKRSCSIDGCDKRYQAQGYCYLHYERLRKYGDPLKTSGRLAPPEVRFWRHVVKTSTCWLWVGARADRGYGSFRADPRSATPAHRFSYELVNGPIPDGLHIDHLCKVTNCVNPDHLEAVTPYENWRRSDSPVTLLAKQTHCKYGHPLSGDNVREIRPKDKPGKVWRECKECRRRRLRERYWRLKEQEGA